MRGGAGLCEAGAEEGVVGVCIGATARRRFGVRVAVVLVDEAEVGGEHFVIFGSEVFFAEVLAFLVLWAVSKLWGLEGGRGDVRLAVGN